MGQTELVVQPATREDRKILEVVGFVLGKGEQAEEGVMSQG